MLVNVENDDHGTLQADVDCTCALAALGLRTRVAHIRGTSKVVSAGITLDGELFDELAEVVLPARLGGQAGDFQFVERETPRGTAVALRVHPRVGEVDPAVANAAVQEALARSDNGVLAASVWAGDGLEVERAEPLVTAAGKTLSFDRLRPGRS